MEQIKKDDTPKKINVIEYKDKLFKTQEEYNAYKREELISQLTYISGHAFNAFNFLETLSSNSINTKAKLDQLILDVKKHIDANAEIDKEVLVKTFGVNCNEEPEDSDLSEKEVEKF